MRWLNKLSYVKKLTLYSMINTALVIGILVSTFLFYHFNTARAELVENLRASAQMMSFNTRTALQTNDLDLLSDTINSLSQKNIIQIVIFSNSGQVVTEYSVKEEQYEYTAKYSRTAGDALFSKNDVLITEPVFSNNELLGSISLRSNLEKHHWLNWRVVYFSVFVICKLFNYSSYSRHMGETIYTYH